MSAETAPSGVSAADDPGGPDLSRALLLPGPQPPLSHFGATLLRHVVATGLRYAFYQLGLPMPEAAPVRILRLRLFLDRTPLDDLVSGEPGGPAVVDALLQPGAAGMMEASAVRLRTAAVLHRLRLRALGPKRHPPRADPAVHGDRAALWQAVRDRLERRLPRLCDLVLWELVESLHRRRRRAQAQSVEPGLGRQAWLWRQDRRAILSCLGVPDPLLPAWSDEATRPRAVPGDEEVGPLPRLSSGRGSFREGYRELLSEIRPALFEIGWLAKEAGIVDEADDVFFVPFDLGGELAASGPADWV
ncbi:MAG: hypothetical protein R3190_07015, partial [Thermoanaerobaculia bacterium]|nr:hypothetical protein [Thermoanaerobaculia bacterium]